MSSKAAWPLVGLLVIASILTFLNREPSISIEPPNDGWFQAEVVEQTTPVLVKFGAEWCGPCRSMEPILEQLANEMRGELKVVDVDIDVKRGLANHYGVRGIPRMFLLDHGKVLASHTGSMPADSLRAWVTRHTATIR